MLKFFRRGHPCPLDTFLVFFIKKKNSYGNLVNASVRPSRYILLNLWPEFNQTCYMTSPRGKGVREQHHFLPCPMWPSGGVTWPVMNLAVPISYQRSLKITNECQKCYQYDLLTVLRSKRHIFLWILFQSGKNDSQTMVWLKNVAWTYLFVKDYCLGIIPLISDILMDFAVVKPLELNMLAAFTLYVLNVSISNSY